LIYKPEAGIVKYTSELLVAIFLLPMVSVKYLENHSNHQS